MERALHIAYLLGMSLDQPLFLIERGNIPDNPKHDNNEDGEDAQYAQLQLSFQFELVNQFQIVFFLDISRLYKMLVKLATYRV